MIRGWRFKGRMLGGFLGIRFLGRYTFVLLAAAIVLPTTWLRSLGALAYVSIAGVVASWILLVCVLWIGAVDEVGFSERGTLLRWNGAPTAASLYLFCYGAHAVFPTLYTSMRSRAMFTKVLLLCFFCGSVNYTLMAIFGYLMYGSEVKTQITLDLPNRLFSSKLAIYTTVVNPLTKYALLISPIAMAIEDRFGACASKLSSSLLIRSLLVLSTTIAALTVPLFGYLMALSGSLLSTMASLLLPCLCYLRIFTHARKWGVEFVAIIIIMLMGIFVAIAGTYTSLKQIVTNL